MILRFNLTLVLAHPGLWLRCALMAIVCAHNPGLWRAAGVDMAAMRRCMEAIAGELSQSYNFVCTI